MQECLVIFCAEICPHAHVKCHGAGDMRGKPFGRIVAARTVLLEHLLAAVGTRWGNPLGLLL